MTINRDLRDLLAEAEKDGCTVERRRNGHLRINTPNGPVFCSSTPSDFRAVHKIRRDLRAKGVAV